MLFKVDENLPIEVTELLRQKGHDALSVHDQMLVGEPDLRIGQVCQQEQRALVTLDLDFSDIRSYPSEEFAGIIVLRPTLQNIKTLLRLMDQVIATLDQEPLVGYLWIVDDTRVRIRGSGPQGSP